MAIDQFSSLENAVFFDLSHVVFVVLNEDRRGEDFVSQCSNWKRNNLCGF